MNSRAMYRATAFIVLLVWSPTESTTQGFAERLKEADRLACLTNWYDALPIYIEVEQAATKAGSRRDAIVGAPAVQHRDTVVDGMRRPASCPR